MSFDYGLAKEIYGTAWSVDAVSFMQLSSILKNIQNGVVLDAPEQKLNSISLLQITSETRIINRTWQLNNSDAFDGIGIVNLNGPITKNGGASSYGTKELSSEMIRMAKDSRVKGFVIKTDSGGGATGAVQLMIDAINEVKKTKPVYALVEKGGMAGSAAYGIISASTGVYSEDGMNIVGSVGTMIQFSGKPHGNVDRDGEKTIVLYATKSTKKNKAFEEAINNDNYDLIINELLDPINENFIASVLNNRPQLKGSSYDDGHTVFSKDAVGTFIDGIASFDDVVQMILSQPQGVNNSNINSNTNTMNKAELKQNHPELYSEILAEGVSNEQERVKSWLAFQEADPKAVSKGIASGKEITPSQTNVFLVSLAKNGIVKDLKSDNIPDVVTGQTSTKVEDDAEKAKEDEAKAAFDFKL